MTVGGGLRFLWDAVEDLFGRLAGWKKVSSDSAAAAECAFG